ncbi:MAG TPA: hypothetical protein VMV18_07710, partial [bacterium]|nr:hypothetical protein [bacterium]
MRALPLAALCVSALALAGAAKPTHGKAKASPTPRHTPVAKASHSPTPAPTAPVVRMLALSSGGTVVPLDLSLDVRVTAEKPPAPGASPAPTPEKLHWEAENGAWIGRARGALWHATIALTPTNGNVALGAELSFDAAVDVEKAALRIRMPGSASAVTRALAWKSVDEIQRVDSGTPILVSSSAMAISGGAGFIAARYLPGHWRSGTFVDTELILDDPAAHPFSTYDECLEKLPADENDPNAVVNWTELEKRTPRDHLTLAPGAALHGRATILLRDEHGAEPLILERWPGGYKAALVFTDHADRTDPAALRAVLYGTTDEKSDDYGKKGFFGHGLALTKTFFAHGSRTGCLQNDANARTLADEIVAHGSEVGSHSITQAPDTRDAVKKGLPVFDPWHSVTWIDHEPYTNCEAVSNQGWQKAAPYGIRDVLAEAGYRWVWAATDLAGSKDAKLIDL